ncbi:unnamed protein product [Lampetra planeri]
MRRSSAGHGGDATWERYESRRAFGKERCARCQAWRCEWSMAGKCCERDQGEEVGKSGAGGGGQASERRALVAVVPRDDRRKTLKPDDEDGIAQRESRGQGGGCVKSRARRDVAERVVVASTKGTAATFQSPERLDLNSRPQTPRTVKSKKNLFISASNEVSFRAFNYATSDR